MHLEKRVLSFNFGFSHRTVLLLYVLLSAAFTYPLVFSLSDAVPAGGAYYDSWGNMWNMWWFKKALVDTRTDMFYTNYMFYPNGVSLAFQSFDPLYSMAAIPLQMLLGLTVTYNLLFLASFVIAGFGAYLLARHLTGNSVASFVAGFIFAFYPSHFAHMYSSHLELVSIGWMPLYILYLFRVRTENSRRNVFFASVFLLFTALTAWYYAIYLVIFTALFVLYYFMFGRSSILNKTFIKSMLVVAAVSLAGALPFAYPMITQYRNYDFSASTAAELTQYSADIFAFVTPSPLNTFVGKYFMDNVYPNFTGHIGESTVFAGYTVLLLSAYAVWRVRKRETLFWLVSAFLFFALSLGPFLHVYGKVTSLPMPYLLFNAVMPFFSVIRVATRFDVMLMLSLAVLAAYALRDIFQRFGAVNAKHVALVVLALLTLEFLSVPVSMFKTPYVSDFYRTIAADKNSYAVMEFPYDYGFSIYMYYQTVHGKKLLHGYVARLPQGAGRFWENNTFYKLFTDQQNFIRYVNSGGLNVTGDDIATLRGYDVRYVIFQKSFTFPRVLQYIRDNIFGKTQPAYEDGLLLVYRI